MKRSNRQRIIYFILVVVTIITGLLSRKFSNAFPDLINLVLGDALYALMVYWMVRLVAPSLPLAPSALIALSFCFTIELSQLYQADWINQIRATRMGSLILGRGFLWSDLLAYTIGVISGLVAENLAKSPTQKT
ncbi:MAG: DUF2809 domain-containing protein [Marinoscillum sp.]